MHMLQFIYSLICGRRCAHMWAALWTAWHCGMQLAHICTFSVQHSLLCSRICASKRLGLRPRMALYRSAAAPLAGQCRVCMCRPMRTVQESSLVDSGMEKRQLAPRGGPPRNQDARTGWGVQTPRGQAAATGWGARTPRRPDAATGWGVQTTRRRPARIICMHMRMAAAITASAWSM